MERQSEQATQESVSLEAFYKRRHSCRWREAWLARPPAMLALVEQLRSYLGGGCEC